jgi:putative transposase
VIPNYPHHVVQSGHNKQIVFAEEADFNYYLETLTEFKQEYDMKVYAFCLMTNHVHLVLEPGDSVAGLGQLMKRLAGRQARYVNRQERRSGTLWESRYKSSPIQSDTYLLACCRYIELNPVRAGMVSLPQDYRWSSFSHRVGENFEYPWLDIDPCFQALGTTDRKRKDRYREFVFSRRPTGEWNLIRDAVQRGQLTGNNRFVDEVEAIIGRRIEHRRQGRPKNCVEKNLSFSKL